MYQKFHSGDSRRFQRSRNHSSNQNWSQKRPNNRFRNNSRGRSRNRFQSDFMDIAFFVNKNVNVESQTAYVPTCQFCDFQIDQKLKTSVIAKKYTTPTPIQDKCIPLVLEGKDIIGLANTGTGKTAAFLIPLINQVIKEPQKKVLIIAPTRELASQINKELLSFVRGMGIYSALITGGSDMRRQIFDLRRRYNFVVGTPGRLIDLVNKHILRLDNISSVVIDEADRMLDMGFIDDIRMLLGKTQKEKQTLLFSATLAPKIELLINDFLKNPVKISVVQKSVNNIYQDVVKYSDVQKKANLLVEMLSKKEFQKVLVFTKTKRGADELSETLFTSNIKNISIHGDKRQSKRRQALKSFKEERIKVLIATDVAARGLDIDNVSHVINYDIPATKDDYIHRIGRTARANKTGTALTFVKEGNQSQSSYTNDRPRRPFTQRRDFRSRPQSRSRYR